MPTYEYRCTNGHDFERFQKMSDDPVAECPECGEASERLISGGAGFIFKGDGFYITDYRSEDYKKAASSDKEASGSGDKDSGGSKTDKPAASKESSTSSGSGSLSKGGGSSGSSSGGGSSASSRSDD